MRQHNAGAPLVSVLLPTYNCRLYLPESIDSILAQTLDDLELIIIDDGSTDDSPLLLDEYAARDDRIRVVRQDNSGAGAALNLGLKLARGKYLARMDADDRTPPQRLIEEVEFLDHHPEITVVGGWHRTFGAAQSYVHEFPTDPDHLKAALLFRNPISHPTVMMRHQAFVDNGWQYSTRRQFPEDYDLWLTIAQRHELANIPSVYLDYRIWPGSMTQDPRLRWRDQVVDVQCRMLARMGLVPDDGQRAIHAALAFDEISGDGSFISAAHAWLLEIERHNRERAALKERGLMRVLTGRYIALVRKAGASQLVVEGLRDSLFRKYVTVEVPWDRT